MACWSDRCGRFVVVRRMAEVEMVVGFPDLGTLYAT